MGGRISTGKNNDELIDILVKYGYIRTKRIERVFRAVDRADYILSTDQTYAYKDLAWRHGNLHLSAPCVYGAAMEFLSLKPGKSFLNLGSGTGYLNTVAGLLLGPHGINHGIELYKDCVTYAYDRLEEFKLYSRALEEFEFCEPAFVQGNCLDLCPDRQYDSVYCGAAVSKSHSAFLKQFVRVGGVIVMPYTDHLFCYKRISETTWTKKTAFPVSFASLIVPETREPNSVTLPECEPMSLQGLCRSKVRQILRKNVWLEHPELESSSRVLPLAQEPEDTGHQSRVIIPIFGDSDDALSTEDEEDDDDQEREHDRDEFIGRARFLLNMETGTEEPVSPTVQLRRLGMRLRHARPGRNWSIDTDNSDEEVVHINFINNPDEAPESQDRSITPTDDDDSDVELTSAPESSGIETQNCSAPATRDDDIETRDGNGTTESSNDRNARTVEQPIQSGGSTERNPQVRCKTIIERFLSSSDGDSDDEERLVQRKKIPKRETVDSGIVEDAQVTPEDTMSSSNVDQDQDQDQDPDENDLDVDLSSVLLRETLQQMCCDANEGNSSSDELSIYNRRMAHYVDGGLFVAYIKEKIQQLPLPTSLKLYINYNRSL